MIDVRWCMGWCCVWLQQEAQCHGWILIHAPHDVLESRPSTVLKSVTISFSYFDWRGKVVHKTSKTLEGSVEIGTCLPSPFFSADDAMTRLCPGTTIASMSSAESSNSSDASSESHLLKGGENGNDKYINFQYTDLLRISQNGNSPKILMFGFNPLKGFCSSVFRFPGPAMVWSPPTPI